MSEADSMTALKSLSKFSHEGSNPPKSLTAVTFKLLMNWSRLVAASLTFCASLALGSLAFPFARDSQSLLASLLTKTLRAAICSSSSLIFDCAAHWWLNHGTKSARFASSAQLHMSFNERIFESISRKCRVSEMTQRAAKASKSVTAALRTVAHSLRKVNSQFANQLVSLESCTHTANPRMITTPMLTGSQNALRKFHIALIRIEAL